MYYKNVLFLLLTYFLTISAGSQVNVVPATSNKVIEPVLIQGQIVGANNAQIVLGSQNVRPKQIVGTAFTDDKGKFKLKTSIPFADYYYLRIDNGQALNLILYGGDSITVYADAKDFLGVSNIINSPASGALNGFVYQFTTFKSFEDSLKNVLKSDPTKQAEVNAVFQEQAMPFYEKRNQFIQQWGGTPALIAAVNAIDQEKEWELFKQVVDALMLSFGQSPTVVNLVNYKAQKVKQLEAMEFLAPGKMSKNIILPDVNGDTLELYDLKGKVVLIDFWASWCRPCRAENPNVVKLYNKYNEDGFTVFSVSLDANKAAWLNAIKMDNLVWPNHVSDLKKWRSAAAQDYAVTSIPFTVLIDRDGTIIATKLRGEELENRLKVIFGY